MIGGWPRGLILLGAGADLSVRANRGARNDISRKMGTYYMATLLFKVYFKVRGGRASLSAGTS